jgi:hypothetical protein
MVIAAVQRRSVQDESNLGDGEQGRNETKTEVHGPSRAVPGIHRDIYDAPWCGSGGEADMQRFFRVTPPSLHRMMLTLEQRGLIEGVRDRSRSIRLLLYSDEIPKLERQWNRRRLLTRHWRRQ